MIVYVFVCPSNYVYVKPKVAFSTNSHSKELARKTEENQTASLASMYGVIVPQTALRQIAARRHPEHSTSLFRVCEAKTSACWMLTSAAPNSEPWEQDGTSSSY
jgi:hypothetical protein